MYSDAIFRGSKHKKTVYLTFDDGPDPEATDFVLDVLKLNGIKATFFVLGKNVLKHPETVERLKSEGHQLANHGMNHLNGWSTACTDYTKDVMDGKQVVGSNIFRPPYGRLSPSQYAKLRKSEKIVFWDVVSGDFDTTINGTQVVDNVVSNVRNGSIIVMHDSMKALPNVKASLGEVIGQLSDKGYSFATLDALLDDKID